MKKYLLLFIIEILQGIFLSQVQAQSLAKIEGKVFSKGKPLEGVTLSLPALGKGCVSDTSGTFFYRVFLRGNTSSRQICSVSNQAKKK
jgi:hypothetical protein